MKNKPILILISLILFFFVDFTCGQNKESEENQNLQYLGNITAPEFPSGLEWLNTNRPVTLKELRGKIVLLDFWTYCCINCMHIIPDLKKLEQKYKNELVVIGVHSAKFLTERGTDNIRNAILRYEVEHPVVNDKDLLVWEQYAAHAWPTLVLIDPKGKIIKTETGEGVYDEFDPIISSAIQEYDRVGGILNREPVKFTLEKEKISKSLLSFPGKIAADATGSRLFITDSDNNRIVILSPYDKTSEVSKTSEVGNNRTSEVWMVTDVIGNGTKGWKDGSYTEAEFFRPQGIAFNNDVLYVVDTENHLLREIDLKNKTVKTIAGTGMQSKQWGVADGDALQTALNSPWDVVYINDELYIAMAGAHQLWKMDLKTNRIGTYAGNGNENIVDGSFGSSSLAQTSGITTDGNLLYFADSEVSAIRSAGLSENGKVKTIVGQGLFDFGDVDGRGVKVRLQHPLGISYNPADKLLYIADTYNNKIKVINPETKESLTYSGTGTEGNRDGGIDAEFNEPSGLTIVNGKIYVTDTNNNLIRVVDMQTKEVKTLIISNPDKLAVPMTMKERKKPLNVIKLDNVELKEGDINLNFNFTLPAGYHINPEALPQVAITSDANISSPFEKEIETKEPSFSLPIPIKGSNGTLNIELLIYYCDTENEGICKYKDLNFELPYKTASNGNVMTTIYYTLN